MTRAPRSRSSLRRRQTHRCLRLEQLDPRHVLSTVVAPAMVDSPPADGVDAASVSATELPAGEVATQVALDEEGILHVRPATDATEVMIRQFLDYRRVEIVEIQAAGEWISVPAAQVSAIQVELAHGEQTLEVAPDVSLGVEQTVISAMDQAIDGGASISIQTGIGVAAELPEGLTADGSSVAAGVAEPMMSGPITPPPGFPNYGGSPEGEPIGGGVVTAPTPPEISEFRVEHTDGVWIFTGRVTDDTSVAGLVIRFGGLLNGSTATVNEQGVFQFTKTFAQGTTGTVTAVTTDADGLTSNQVSCTIS